MPRTSIQNVPPDNPAFPTTLLQIPQPPEMLYICSDNWHDLLQRPRVAIIGSRKATPYGRQVTIMLAEALARAGIVVVSGLAIGIDSIAHRAALHVGGLTVAVLPSALDAVYPALHKSLAEDIVKQGGALVSEYRAGSTFYKSNFIARNRIVAGISGAVLITEASLKSGTLHTARFALEQGIDVLAVPGNITSAASRGTNNLIKSGAMVITSAEEVFSLLRIPYAKTSLPQGRNNTEDLLISLVASGVSDGEELLAHSKLTVSTFNQTLTMLEITGAIRPMGGNQWSIG